MYLIQRAQRSKRRGGALFWLLLCLGTILGFVALVMDSGRMMEQRRRTQAGADAAALAAAYKLFEAYPQSGESAAGTAARAIAADNGFPNDAVTVNIPPTSGPYTGKSDCVEIVIESKLPASFGAIVTGQDLTVRSRAVARGRPARIGLIALKSSGANTFNNSAVAFALLGSPIIVNSSDAAALRNTGLLLTAKSFEVTGGISNTGIMVGKKRTGMTPTADPLRYLPFPNSAGQPVRSAALLTVNALLPTVLDPGIYQGGIKITGLSTVLMRPGTYVMEGGGFEISGLATVTGLGVLIHNTSGAFPGGPININTLGRVVVTAPGAGAYRGINVLQDRNLAQPISLSGNGLIAVSGLIYAPAAPVSLRGLLAVGVDTLGGGYICDTMAVSGVGTVNLDLGNNLPQIPEINLVD